MWVRILRPSCNAMSPKFRQRVYQEGRRNSNLQMRLSTNTTVSNGTEAEAIRRQCKIANQPSCDCLEHKILFFLRIFLAASALLLMTISVQKPSEDTWLHSETFTRLTNLLLCLTQKVAQAKLFRSHMSQNKRIFLRGPSQPQKNSSFLGMGISVIVWRRRFASSQWPQLPLSL